MGWRKGYYAELLCKKKLQEQYGKENVIKVAICGALDYIVLKNGKIVKFVEVKNTHEKKYYPTKKEKLQFKRIKLLAKEHNVPFELWIKFQRKPFIIKSL